MITALGIAGAAAIAALLIVTAFVAALVRLVRFLDDNYGVFDTADWLGPSKRSRTPQPPADPVWWDSFERQFADYVESLG